MSPGRILPATYRVVVRGELGDQFEAIFDGWRFERVDGTTVLTGGLRDQSHLAGVIDRLQELGLEIVSLAEVDAPAAG